MDIKEKIVLFNIAKDNPVVKQYLDIKDTYEVKNYESLLRDIAFFDGDGFEEEYANINGTRYILVHPHDKVRQVGETYFVEKTGFDGIIHASYSSTFLCLSGCSMSREDIIERFDKLIEEEN